MKILVIAIVILLFNVANSVVINSGVFTNPGYYENTISDDLNTQLSGFENVSSSNIESQSVDLWQVMKDVVAFDYVNQYANALGMENELAPLTYGLSVLLLMLSSIGLIELVWRRSDIIK